MSISDIQPFKVVPMISVMSVSTPTPHLATGRKAILQANGHHFEIHTLTASLNQANCALLMPCTPTPAILGTENSDEKDAEIMKILFQDQIRLHAASTIPRATDNAPHVVQLLDDSSTQAWIKRLLGLSTPPARTCRRFAIEELQPITSLQSMDLWKAYWETIKGHYIAWEAGIHHGDISVNNLMHRCGVGILNDFDVSRIGIPRESATASQRYTRTGTMPFMALDLLTKDARHGKVEHLYRHDLESFYWILLWTCACFENGKQTMLSKKYQYWLAGDYQRCSNAKVAFGINDICATASYQDLLPGAYEFFDFWYQLSNEKYERTRTERNAVRHGLEPEPYVEPPARQFLEKCLQVMHSSDPLEWALQDNLFDDIPTIADISRLQTLVNSLQT